MYINIMTIVYIIYTQLVYQWYIRLMNVMYITMSQQNYNNKHSVNLTLLFNAKHVANIVLDICRGT